ncbi:MAG: RNA polymerase sigma factor [Planctomycetes bacterium]|nr:RNA polymerase sigma factor [Planctomycetota bacterium]
MPSPRHRRSTGSANPPPRPVPFEEVVREYEKALFGAALRIVGDRDLAEDVLQSAFLKAYNALPSLKPGSNLRAWLYRILVNTAYDHLERRKTYARALEAAASRAPAASRGYDESEADRQRELSRSVEAAVRSLPARYRDALLLRSIQGLSYAEVAEALGIPETTARSLVHRGKQMLVPKLAAWME